jgi:broad specificity phosphatase PhoE
MAEIYLVRHGQASFGADNYDQLSSRGQKQSLLTGQKYTRCVKPCLVFTGQHKRHQQTLDGFKQGLDVVDVDLPAEWQSPQVMSGFNEFDHEQVLFRAYPDLADKKALALELAKHEKPQSHFHYLFQKAVERWISGQFDTEYDESWVSFQQRCKDALSHVKAQVLAAEGVSQAWVFTSGGPVAAVAQAVMGLSDGATFELNENLANTGVTRLLFSGSKVSVSYLNSIGHLLEKPEYVTYR